MEKEKKKASLWGLVYAEHYQCQKVIRNYMILALVFTVVVLLVQLSLRIGNLARLPKDILVTAKEFGLGAGKAVPLYMLLMFPTTTMETMVRQENETIHKFRLSMPISGFDFALAKAVYALILSVVGILLGVLYLCLFEKLFPGSVGAGSFASIFLILAVSNNFSSLIIIFGSFFRSIEKAAMAISLVILAFMSVLIVLVAPYIPQQTADEMMNPFTLIEGRALNWLPYTIPATLLSFVLLYVLLGLIYKRREK